MADPDHLFKINNLLLQEHEFNELPDEANIEEDTETCPETSSQTLHDKYNISQKTANDLYEMAGEKMWVQPYKIDTQIRSSVRVMIDEVLVKVRCHVLEDGDGQCKRRRLVEWIVICV